MKTRVVSGRVIRQLIIFFELLKLKKKKLFVTFVDFEKTFDKVWRDGLWFIFCFIYLFLYCNNLSTICCL
jgi:hypothetical protein